MAPRSGGRVDEEEGGTVSEIKLCKDCKFCEPQVHTRGLIFRRKDVDYRFAQCGSWLGGKPRVDLVSGEPLSPKQWYCETQRSGFGECGARARYFEPRGDQ
jgi:hypothetical protein